MAKIFSCMKPKALGFRKEGVPLGGPKMTAFQSGLLCPLAALSLVPYSNFWVSFKRWTQHDYSWLFEGTTNLPFPLAIRSSEHRGPEAGSMLRSLPQFAYTRWAPKPACHSWWELRLVQPLPSPTCSFLGRFKYVWLQMNVFKMYLMPFIFSVLNMTTQDSNTEISKLYFFFPTITDFKICPNRDLGFIKPSSANVQRSQFKENGVFWGKALFRPTHWHF